MPKYIKLYNKMLCAIKKYKDLVLIIKKYLELNPNIVIVGDDYNVNDDVKKVAFFLSK